MFPVPMKKNLYYFPGGINVQVLTIQQTVMMSKASNKPKVQTRVKLRISDANTEKQKKVVLQPGEYITCKKIKKSFVLYLVQDGSPNYLSASGEYNIVHLLRTQVVPHLKYAIETERTVKEGYSYSLYAAFKRIGYVHSFITDVENSVEKVCEWRHIHTVPSLQLVWLNFEDGTVSIGMKMPYTCSSGKSICKSGFYLLRNNTDNRLVKATRTPIEWGSI